ncbi:MAG: hypothetical protein ABIP35_10685 [Ginsengibacter sp.]
MNSRLYNPFEKFSFTNEECFLTGKKVNPETEMISVFPEWIMERYSLSDQPFSMLGENKVLYSQLQIPCDSNVLENTINPLEEEIRKAFLEGFESVKKLDETRLFQWMGKLVYGILFRDIAYGVEMQKASGKEFKLSPYLVKKFMNLHNMLQSLVLPMEFKEKNPWSIAVVKVKYSKDIFNYKDETKNLNFSLAMNGFGIVACLQDNGENLIYQNDLLKKIGDTPLHPIQFEELWCRFMYSNYLLEANSQFAFDDDGNKIIVQSIPIKEGDQNPVFKKWDEKMYAQVLANYWKPWGLGMADIYNFPNSPISYLLDEYSNQLIGPDSIELQF